MRTAEFTYSVTVAYSHEVHSVPNLPLACMEQEER